WRAPRTMQGLITRALRGFGKLVLDPALKRLREQIGAPQVLDSVAAAALNLGVWPQWFRPPAPDDPPRARMCGFVFDAAGPSSPLSDEVRSFLDAGPPPVVAGFGSAASLHAADRYRAIAAACTKIGSR